MPIALSVAASGELILLSICHRPGLIIGDGVWALTWPTMRAQASKLRRSGDGFIWSLRKIADPSIRYGKRGTLAVLLQVVIYKLDLQRVFDCDATHVHAGDAAFVRFQDFVAETI